MCVDGFKNFDFLRSFLNVSVELYLYPESHYRKILLQVGKKGTGYFLNVKDVGYECAEMEFLDINLTKD
jgi:hypothetical protein